MDETLGAGTECARAGAGDVSCFNQQNAGLRIKAKKAGEKGGAKEVAKSAGEDERIICGNGAAIGPCVHGEALVTDIVIEAKTRVAAHDAGIGEEERMLGFVGQGKAETTLSSDRKGSTVDPDIRIDDRRIIGRRSDRTIIIKSGIHRRSREPAKEAQASKEKELLHSFGEEGEAHDIRAVVFPGSNSASPAR